VAKLVSQLSEMIIRDDYAIQRIDEQTEQALSCMENAQTELERLYEKVKGNKCLMLKAFAALIVAALIFILIV
jgi:t-SNARE complex subunit (syntaxin)